MRDREIAAEDRDARLGWLLGSRDDPRRRDRGAVGGTAAQPLRLGPDGGDLPDVNGVLLLVFERFRRRPPRPGDYLGDSDAADLEDGLQAGVRDGVAQAAALVPGISRSGVTMGGGLLTGLSNEDAARYAFLLATPIIGAAGVLKLPELLGSAGNGVRAQALVGALAAALTTYLAVRFLLRFFETNRLTPFGIYCILAGLASSLIFAF